MGHPRQGESVSLDLLSSDLSGGAFVVLRDANMQARTLLPTERFILDMLEAQVASGIAVDVHLVGYTMEGPPLNITFSEGSGTTSVNQGSLGTANNATLTNASWDGALGNRTSSMDTSGGTYASGSDAGLPSGNAPFTGFVWFKITSVSAYNYILAWGTDNTSQAVYIQMTGDGLYPEFTIPGVTAYPITNPDATDGNQHLYTVTYDGTNLLQYWDGALDDSQAISPLNIVRTGTIYYGYSSLGDHPPIVGAIGDTGFDAVAWTAGQIATYYATGQTPTSLVLGTLPNSLLASFYPGVGFMEVPSEGMSLPPNQVPFAIASGAGTVHLVGSGRIVQDCQFMGRPSWQANLNP